MNEVSASAFAGLFILIAGIYYFLVIQQLARSLPALHNALRQKRLFKRIMIVMVGWAVFISLWSGTGMMSNFSIFPFNVLPVVAIPMITMVIITFSRTTAALLAVIPPSRIIFLQSFRFFVEVCLWLLYRNGSLPSQATFEGRNYDVAVGVTAPIVAYFVFTKRFQRRVILLWNLLSLALLVNIVSVAILSMPSPIRQFSNEPSAILLTQFPGAWLPGLLVPLAYGLHFFSLRQLSLDETKNSTDGPRSIIV